jgi:ABC-type nitrate/sulfonate/bicarbonate transport system substrate-binding protein
VTGPIRKIGYWSCCLAVLAVLGGCGGGESSKLAATGAETTEARKEETMPPKGETTVPEVFKTRGPLECPTHSSEDIAVTLDADADAENIGVMMAEAEGFYEDVGLRVFTGGPKNPARAVKYVALGIDEIGVAQLPQVLLAEEEKGGAPLLAIGSVIQQNNAAMIWLADSGIGEIADLAGKTIGIPGVPFQEDFLEAVLARAGLTLEDVTVKRTNYRSVAALLEERVDALFGVTWNNEGAALEARGAEPVVTRARSLGLPGYEELAVVAPAKCVAAHPAVYRDFMTAMARGMKAVRSDPAAAARLMKQNYGLDPRFRISDVWAPLKATLPQLSSDAHMNLGQVANLAAWMHKERILKGKPPIEEMFTNDYLAP